MNKNKMLNIRNLVIFSGLILVAMFVLSAWAWVQIPADQPVPVHWGINGEPDRYGSKFEGLLLMPLIYTAVCALLAVVPRIDPRGNNILRSGKAYGALWIAMMLFFLILHVVLILNTLGINAPVDMVIPIGVGALFVVIGNYMGKVRRNYMFGIRTPWTLASELSWNKTHRLGGRLFVLLGLVMIASAAFATGMVTFVIMFAGIIGMLIGVFAYSYVVWKQDPNVQTE
ncbi:MAG: SdpI family protein [Anaerolineales bacterium]|nr:SdpI family protein [Anaerolineales bacterium]